jgi:hypothetical protein
MKIGVLYKLILGRENDPFSFYEEKHGSVGAEKKEITPTC